MERRIKESDLSKESLEMLGEYEINTNWMGVFVMFNPKSLCLSETEAEALSEFGKVNFIYLTNVLIAVLENSYRATAFYPSGEYTEGY